jgi:hypothetical protein
MSDNALCFFGAAERHPPPTKSATGETLYELARSRQAALLLTELVRTVASVGDAATMIETYGRRSARRDQRVSGPGNQRLMREVRRAELVAAIGKPCAYCGEPMVTPSRDHIRPLSKGGTLAPHNRALVCDRPIPTKKQPLACIVAVPAPKSRRSASRDPGPDACVIKMRDGGRDDRT